MMATPPWRLPICALANLSPELGPARAGFFRFGGGDERRADRVRQGRNASRVEFSARDASPGSPRCEDTIQVEAESYRKKAMKRKVGPAVSYVDRAPSTSTGRVHQ